jgi:hypothetical protein
MTEIPLPNHLVYMPSDTKSQEALTFCPSLRLGAHPGCPEMPSLTDRIRPSLFLRFDDTQTGGTLFPAFLFLAHGSWCMYVFVQKVLFRLSTLISRDENAMEIKKSRD